MLKFSTEEQEGAHEKVLILMQRCLKTPIPWISSSWKRYNYNYQKLQWCKLRLLSLSFLINKTPFAIVSTASQCFLFFRFLTHYFLKKFREVYYTTLACAICWLWRLMSLSADLRGLSNSGRSSLRVSSNNMSRNPSRLSDKERVDTLEKGSGYCPSPGVKRGKDELR